VGKYHISAMSSYLSMSFLFKALLHSLYFKVCLSKPELTTVCAVVHFEPVFMATKSRRGYNFGIAVPLY